MRLAFKRKEEPAAPIAVKEIVAKPIEQEMESIKEEINQPAIQGQDIREVPVEVEINLTYLNNKLNYVIQNLIEIRRKLEE